MRGESHGSVLDAGRIDEGELLLVLKGCPKLPVAPCARGRPACLDVHMPREHRGRVEIWLSGIGERGRCLMGLLERSRIIAEPGWNRLVPLVVDFRRDRPEEYLSSVHGDRRTALLDSSVRERRQHDVVRRLGHGNPVVLRWRVRHCARPSERLFRFPYGLSSPAMTSRKLFLE